jgi:hypothetical protein
MSTSPRKLSSAKSLDARLNPTIPAWGTASWLTSLTLLQIISDELLKEKHQNQTEAAFIKGMTKEDLLRSFEQTIPLLKNALTEGLDKLQGQADVDATLLNDKFSASKGSFTFTYGGKFIFNLYCKRTHAAYDMQRTQGTQFVHPLHYPHCTVWANWTNN